MAEPITQTSPANNNSIDPHEMRITEHAKMHSLIGFGLKFLQENPNRPLVLHTLPAKEKRPETVNGTTEASQTGANTSDSTSAHEPPRKKQKLPTPTNTIPRLVSVVEIIRREYAAWAFNRKTPDGRPAESTLRTGLHQYNELSTLEELGVIDLNEQVLDDAEELKYALGGKNFLRQKFSPHLKVTLSVRALPELETKGATYQPPRPVSKSRSARKREQRKKRKEAWAEDSGGVIVTQT